LVLPAAYRALEATSVARLLDLIQRRLDPLGWFCLAVLAVTGMFQMSSNPNYQGFLAITSPWAMAILFKHLVILLMVALSAYLTWVLLPQVRRTALQRAAGQDTPPVESLLQREQRLLRLNLILGVLVLALTAAARAA
jgi:uncharacterized membrane protein